MRLTAARPGLFRCRQHNNYTALPSGSCAWLTVALKNAASMPDNRQSNWTQCRESIKDGRISEIDFAVVQPAEFSRS